MYEFHISNNKPPEQLLRVKSENCFQQSYKTKQCNRATFSNASESILKKSSMYVKNTSHISLWKESESNEKNMEKKRGKSMKIRTEEPN